MIVGICTVELELPTAHSLKEKRQIIQSLMRRVRNEFNVSICEVDQQEIWQAAVLAMACVATDASYAHGLLNKAVQFIEQTRLDAVMANFQIELL